MDKKTAILVLSALAHETRLSAFQLLVCHEPDGLAAGEVARLLGVPQNTMSVHLATLARAGLVRPEKHSRQKIYRANSKRLSTLSLFLIEGCCGGEAELRLPPLKDSMV